MNYPLISEYVEAIKSAEDNFATLTNLRPVLDEDDNPVMTSGNFAVVFKMKDEENGKFYAVKCFLKDQPNRAESYKMIADELEYVTSPFLVQFRYLDKELFVDTNNSDEEEFPVLVMDWVEGVTLDKYIRQNIDDQYVLQMLAYQFSKLAMWIIPQPFAHGDIKPDNVMVREDGSLVLIDYDGMYVPAMKGQKARELGSPDFRHPLRTEEDFDEHIDDFPLASILLSLRVIANDSSLLTKYGAADRLLFSEKDYREISSCLLIKEIFPSNEVEINLLVSLFISLLQKGHMTTLLPLYNIKRPKTFAKSFSNATKISSNLYFDKFGAKYSLDRKVLIKVPYSIQSYSIEPGTKKIKSYAFSLCQSLVNVSFPNSLTDIDPSAFLECKRLPSLNIPENVNRIGEFAFAGCSSLEYVTIHEGVTSIGGSAFKNCKSLQSIYMPNSITALGDEIATHGVWVKSNRVSIFDGCKSLRFVMIPYGSKYKFERLLPDFKGLLKEIRYKIYNWKLKEIRMFTKEEIDVVKKAIIVQTKYGLSVRFYMKSGGHTFIPLSSQSLLKAGDYMDITGAKLITLSRKGDSDIFRVLE